MRRLTVILSVVLLAAGCVMPTDERVDDSGRIAESLVGEEETRWAEDRPEGFAGDEAAAEASESRRDLVGPGADEALEPDPQPWEDDSDLRGLDLDTDGEPDPQPW